jgi:hypothetical protein
MTTTPFIAREAQNLGRTEMRDTPERIRKIDRHKPKYNLRPSTIAVRAALCRKAILE